MYHPRIIHLCNVKEFSPSKRIIFRSLIYLFVSWLHNKDKPAAMANFLSLNIGCRDRTMSPYPCMINIYSWYKHDKYTLQVLYSPTLVPMMPMNG